jgi:hypothetical protein
MTAAPRINYLRDLLESYRAAAASEPVYDLPDVFDLSRRPKLVCSKKRPRAGSMPAGLLKYHLPLAAGQQVYIRVARDLSCLLGPFTLLGKVPSGDFTLWVLEFEGRQYVTRDTSLDAMDVFELHNAASSSTLLDPDLNVIVKNLAHLGPEFYRVDPSTPAQYLIVSIAGHGPLSVIGPVFPLTDDMYVHMEMPAVVDIKDVPVAAVLTAAQWQRITETRAAVLADLLVKYPPARRALQD